MDITELLTATIKNNASDLHMTTGRAPMLRVHGDVLPLQYAALNADQVKQLLYSVMTESQRAEYERELEIDFAISFGEHMRFRVNAFTALEGPAAVMRNIPTKVLSLEDLRAPEIFKKISSLHKGLVLVTGPTGSGKSTTMAAMVDYINNTMNGHILTIEDPVEFVHKSKKCIINHREVGTSTKSFARALKSALREDPDVILVGELRDLETIQLAITAAETGHLVMGTLHTSSAPKTIDRIIDVFPGESQEMIRAMLSESLEAVISQTLLKKIGGGRVAAHEILLGTPAVRNLIREGKVAQIYSLMQIGSKMGMQTMKECVYRLTEQGLVTQEEARDVLVSLTEQQEGDDTKTRAAAKPAASAFGAQGGF
ncbi:MAG: type IV pilus twitching motility protein PilT [Alphaproteobacteria bacterium]|nr:type IV pilus twitching motility protein PilT [Alphaproteobacteria bacterium]